MIYAIIVITVILSLLLFLFWKRFNNQSVLINNELSNIKKDINKVFNQIEENNKNTIKQISNITDETKVNIESINKSLNELSGSLQNSKDNIKSNKCDIENILKSFNKTRNEISETLKNNEKIIDEICRELVLLEESDQKLSEHSREILDLFQIRHKVH